LYNGAFSKQTANTANPTAKYIKKAIITLLPI
jgi:hypothetical protein